jgi:polysaccharide export outer membrane protein
MTQFMLKKWPLFIACLSFIITGCGTTGSGFSNDDTKSSSTKGQAVFSDISELNYNSSSSEAYRIGPNDLLEINVFRVDELSRSVRVDDRGNISLPLVGSMHVTGMTQQGFEKKLASILSKKYLQNPQVSVFIKEFTSKQVTVGGAVKRPGVFPIKGKTSVMQSIAMAEGLTDLAAEDKIVLFRENKGKLKAYNLNLAAIRNGKMPDPYVKGNDRIVVHQSGSKVWLKSVTSTIRGFVSPLSF